MSTEFWILAVALFFVVACLIALVKTDGDLEMKIGFVDKLNINQDSEISKLQKQVQSLNLSLNEKQGEIAKLYEDLDVMRDQLSAFSETVRFQDLRQRHVEDRLIRVSALPRKIQLEIKENKCEEASKKTRSAAIDKVEKIFKKAEGVNGKERAVNKR
jgi:chromosome segregation ATPase